MSNLLLLFMAKIRYLILLIIMVTLASLLYAYLKSNLNSKEIINPTSGIKLYSTPTPTATSTPSPSVRIGLVGDLGLGRFITSTARNKNDFSWSFTGVSSWLQQNDFNLANLESPIIENCPEGKTGTFTFCGDSRFLPQLKENKFVFNLANNHILNYGRDGLHQTEKYLSQNDVVYVYSHAPQTEFKKYTINDIKFGFLGFDLTGAHQIDKESILPLVKKYDPEVDWLIVSLHWGNEYLKTPESWRQQMAYTLIDGGADIIHGHHPHVLQPSEIYKNKPIFYSLGNFIFDQNWSKETSTSEMVKLILDKDQVKSIDKTPIIIKDNSRPEIVSKP